jgi:hypothetical protein
MMEVMNDPGLIKVSEIPDYENLIERDQLVRHARQIMSHEFDTVIDTFPKMLEQIIDNDCWKRRLLRSYNTICEFDYFGEFITAELPRGLNTTVDNIRIALTRFPKIWSKVDELLQRPVGTNQHSKGVNNINNLIERPTGTSKAATIRRLKKDAPELAEKVLNEEMTANAAAILAGFRKKTITHPADVDGFAAAIKRYLTDEQIKKLIKQVA